MQPYFNSQDPILDSFVTSIGQLNTGAKPMDFTTGKYLWSQALYHLLSQPWVKGVLEEKWDDLGEGGGTTGVHYALAILGFWMAP